MKMIWRSTLREIKESFGRFIAILAIVALGVGFFAGLKVTRAAMVETTTDYLAEQGFYDFRLLSTMGFEEEEVAYLRQQEGVCGAEGAVSFDILYRNTAGSESVAKVHSITEELNSLVILNGRMPENAGECVADANVFTEASIGESLTLSENNAEEDLEHFARREYTIVGIAQSPLYIQYERGNTSLGTGKISGFIYLPYESFDVDYYTEIYVRFTEDFPLYSDAYKDFIAEKEIVWEDCASQAADMRYQRILADAEEELADAREEFETEKADAEKELADAREELEDAREQLEDGERQLADAREELADARRTLADKEKELADGEREIADKEKEVAEGEVEIRDGYEALARGGQQLDAAEAELEAGRKELEAQRAALEEKSAEIAAGEQILAGKETEMQSASMQLSQARQELERQEKELNDQIALGSIPADMAAAMSAQITAAKGELGKQEETIEAGQEQLVQSRQELEAGKAAIAEGMSAIAAYEQQLLAGQEQIAAGRQQLDEAGSQLWEGQQELAEGRAALEDARAQLEDGKKQLADARKEMEDAERTLAEKEQELADGQAEYEDGQAEYEDGVSEFDEKIADAQRELDDAEREIEDLEPPDSYLLGRDTNVGYVCFENDSTIVEGIANIFPVFFFLVAALVCITTMNRMVEEQRTQIGVLKALGYSERVIMSKYTFYSGSAAVLGCVIGYMGGTWLFPKVLWAAYGIMYRVDTLVYVFDWKLAVISLIVSILCSVGTTWLSCRMELKEVAAQLMRPKSPKVGKRVFLEYVTFLWKRLGFLRKVSIRNIFRYRKRLIMMVMGISGCTALLLTGFGIKDSIANVATQQFEEIQIYDLDVLFSEDISEEILSKTDEIIRDVTGTDAGQYVPVYETTYDLVTESGRKTVNVLLFEEEADMAPFLDLHTKGREQLAFPGAGELVITDKIARSYGITIGDTVTLQNEDMQTITARVSGINQNFIYNYVYISSETYREQTGKEAGCRNLYLNIPEGADVHLIAAALMKWEDVASVSVNADTMERFSSMMKSLDLIVVFVIACAAGLAFIVLYNLTNINITERIREIATIKVLGFHKRETASYVFRENMVLAAMGIVVGLPLGRLLHWFVMNEIQVDMIAFDIRVRPVSYLYSVVLTYLFAWLVNRLMNGKLEKISMTESLKSVD
ncbi:MAG: FtsX-like permease family protein [Lachnospiraceae bacterium]|nr:FtsX-like permease family protein [Muribaculaceae bacterium]MCM1411299.1 FtsX-like permease family protein [Lachnospiraceae bacterium]